MALGDFIKKIWQNGLAPALNATNLQKNEDKIYELDQWAAAHKAEKAKYHTATGSNAITITTGGNFNLTQGNWIKWIQELTNTGAVTINVDSNGAKALKNPDGTDLMAEDLVAGNPYEAFYSLGDDFFILRPKGAKLDEIIAAIESWGGTVPAPQKASDVVTAINNVASWDADLTASNIKNGVDIFGVVGNYITPFIKSIQRGQSQAGGTNYATQYATINAVNTNYSVIIITGAGRSNFISTEIEVGAYFVNSTTLQFAYTNSETINVYWQVIEFEPSVVKSLQKGQATAGGASFGQSYAISSVNLSKTILIHSGDRQTNGWLNNSYNTGIYLSNSSTLQTACSSSTTKYIFWFVVEFN